LNQLTFSPSGARLLTWAAATTEILDRESKDFLADVELFVEAECANLTGRTPVGFEVSFGRPLDDDSEPLAREEAVTIDLGGGLTFRIAGRIDRIDKVGERPAFLWPLEPLAGNLNGGALTRGTYSINRTGPERGKRPCMHNAARS
jgi:hypothetical protein